MSEPEEDDGDSEEGFQWDKRSSIQTSWEENFIGLEALSPSIGFSCTKMASHLDRYMSYKIFGTCPDDSDMAQKLIANGCDPLPRRRRCFTRTPPHYTNPFPTNSSLWTRPSDANILRNHYKCEDYSCLVFVSKETMDKRDFFK
ncbi:hypothetical protein PanWU01x14_278000 [Parasponia andersonii]|uniref:Uncharacterized protein n=1 Tax=Parasponia andersonii TaxID=3476 RepID=A0A2P5B284_PARAD|nr:hypothetical protein PanWU01x14_278000 [Parasponia andersonii]